METKNPSNKNNNSAEITASELMPKNAQDLNILKMRAERIARAQEKPTDISKTHFYIRFRLSNDFYGVPYQYAREVIQKSSLTTIPLVPNFISGLINWRGMLLTVVNLKILFNLNDKKNENDKRSIIVISTKQMSIGLLVDDISGNDLYDTTNMDMPLFSENTIKQEYILGLHEGKTAIINVENIFSEIKSQLDQFSKTK